MMIRKNGMLICCGDMLSHLFVPRLQMIFDDGDWEDKTIHYEPRFEEYGIPIPDGGQSEIVIRFCPWCGKALPPSRRNAWFDAIEAMGLEPGD